jgi:hypothetical protein
MPAKLALHSLVEKIQSGRISEGEMARCFLLEQNPYRPFDYVVGINGDTVDVTNVERTAISADALLRDAGAVLDRRQAGKASRRAGTRYRRKTPIIAEGDSWFKLPDLHPFVPWTLVNFLQRKYPISNLAHWGDTLADMILVGEFWPYLMSGDSDVLLFSAGGNDILGDGELWQYLNLFNVDHDKPADAPYYVNGDFYLNLDVIIGQYESLIREIELRAPHVIVVGHGYDYAIPQPDGPWLGGPMLRQGLDPGFRPQLCQAIVRVMIDAFNHRLRILQGHHAKTFKYVDLRGTIRANQWWDELHPLDAGARKTAAKFAAALDRLPASGTVAPPLAVAHRHLLRAA